MFGTQELFDKELQRLFTIEVVGPQLIAARLEKIGVRLTEQQIRELENQLLSRHGDTLSLDITDEQVAATGLGEDELRPLVEHAVGGLAEGIEHLLGDVDSFLEDVVEDVSNALSDSVLVDIEKRIPELLDHESASTQAIAERVARTWGRAFGLLETYITIADEAADAYLAKFCRWDSSQPALEAIARIHARASQISKEALTLLRQGFADGAQARWRSLHELAVVASFLLKYGDTAAERYLAHEAIEAYKGAVQYNVYYARLGGERIRDDELRVLKEEYDRLVVVYGEEYRNEYGWASPFLNTGKPKFLDIEAAVDLDHVRPIYKAASGNIHANPSGVLRRLGLCPEEDVLLCGSSDLGLADPGIWSTLSLGQVHVALVTSTPTLDGIVVSKLMLKLGRRVEHAFIEAERKHGRRTMVSKERKPITRSTVGHNKKGDTHNSL